jgi:hypothetical protein
MDFSSREYDHRQAFGESKETAEKHSFSRLNAMRICKRLKTIA